MLSEASQRRHCPPGPQGVHHPPGRLTRNTPRTARGARSQQAAVNPTAALASAGADRGLRDRRRPTSRDVWPPSSGHDSAWRPVWRFRERSGVAPAQFGQRVSSSDLSDRCATQRRHASSTGRDGGAHLWSGPRFVEGLRRRSASPQAVDFRSRTDALSPASCSLLNARTGHPR